MDALAAESREAQSENSLESREREPGESIASPASMLVSFVAPC